ncbi:MAG: hypothetical protein ABW032_06600 [Burkholderiaceae bacterium]
MIKTSLLAALALVAFSAGVSAQGGSGGDAARQGRMDEAYRSYHEGPMAHAEDVTKRDARRAGHAVRRGATKAGHAVKRGAVATSHAIQHGAAATGHAIHRGAVATGDQFRRTVNGQETPHPKDKATTAHP